MYRGATHMFINKSCTKLNGRTALSTMYYCRILLVFCGILASVFCAECNKTAIQITVFKYIDSDGENVTLQGNVQHPRDIFHLIIANQTVPKLCPNFVHIQNELSILQIINNSVSEILPGAFNITPTLTLLRIIQNPVTTIKANIFNSIKVKEIDLSENFINAIEKEAFDNNTHLEILRINNNQIKELNPDWFTNSPNVYKLSAIYNDIKSIPAEAFKNMDRNRPLKLRLSANRITEIDPEAFSEHHIIQVLRINGNKLQNLPDGLFINRTIQTLLVSTNQLQCFPDVLFNSSITKLVFDDNLTFECECLKKVKRFAEENPIFDVLYPSVICEDRAREVNIVFNYNRTYEIPILPPAVDVDVYVKPEQPPAQL